MVLDSVSASAPCYKLERRRCLRRHGARYDARRVCPRNGRAGLSLIACPHCLLGARGGARWAHPRYRRQLGEGRTPDTGRGWASCISGLLVGEGVYGFAYIADTTYPPYWWGEIIVGAGLLCCVARRRFRRLYPAALAVVLTLVVAAALGRMAGLDPVASFP